MAQKSDIEYELTTLRIASRNRWTEEQIRAWLKNFVQGEELDKEFQRRIIDVFINSVYIYDEKIIIYYNIKDGKQVSYVEMIENMEEAVDDTPIDGVVEGWDGVMDSVHSPFLKRFQNSTE